MGGSIFLSLDVSMGKWGVAYSETIYNCFLSFRATWRWRPWGCWHFNSIEFSWLFWLILLPPFGSMIFYEFFIESRYSDSFKRAVWKFRDLVSFLVACYTYIAMSGNPHKLYYIFTNLTLLFYFNNNIPISFNFIQSYWFYRVFI